MFLPTCSGTVYRSCWTSRLGRAGFCPGCWTHTRSSFGPTEAEEGSELVAWSVERHPPEPGYRCCAGSGGNPKDGGWDETLKHTSRWIALKLDLFTFIRHLFLRRTITSSLLDWEQCQWSIQKEAGSTHAHRVETRCATRKKEAVRSCWGKSSTKGG